MTEQEMGKIIRGDDYFEMTPQREAHLSSIQESFLEKVQAKYLAGQKQHGGNLYEKSGLLDAAIDEAIDQVVYLLTLKEQLEKK